MSNYSEADLAKFREAHSVSGYGFLSEEDDPYGFRSFESLPFEPQIVPLFRPDIVVEAMVQTSVMCGHDPDNAISAMHLLWKEFVASLRVNFTDEQIDRMVAKAFPEDVEEVREASE